MPLRTVGVKLAAEVSGYVNNMRAAGTATKGFVGELDKAAKAGRLDAVANQAATMGFALAGAFAGVVAVTAKFDKQMSEVGAVSGATAEQMGQLRDAALEAGKATAFSASEAAKAEAELAKAGLSTSEILGGALKGSLSLAAAGTLDLAESADIAAKTMNVFQLEGKDVGHIADVLAAAANKSATDVHEMGEALRMGGLASKSAGMSLEETVGTLAAFADRALVGSDAGTSLKTALMMLQAPSGKAKKLMEELGIEAYDAGGNFIGTAKLAGVLQAQLGDMTQEQRNAALATIFGADAMRAANVLYEVGEQGIRGYVAAVDDQGAAADVAAKKMDNLAGDIEKLKGSLETMAIEAGSGSTSGLRFMVQVADELVGSLSAIPAPIQTTVIAIAGISGVALLAAAGAAKLKLAVAEATAGMAAAGPAAQRMASGLQTASVWAGRAAGAFAALSVIDAVIGSFDDGAPNVDRLGKSLQEYVKSGRAAGEATRLFGDDLEMFGQDAQMTFHQADSGVAGFFASLEKLPVVGRAAEKSTEWIWGSSWTKGKENIGAVDEALASLIQTQGRDEGFKVWSQLLLDSGLNADELLKILPATEQAFKDAGSGAEGAADGINKVKTEAEQAAAEVQALKDAFDALFGITMTLDRATLKYKEGLAELTNMARENGTSLDQNTEKGRANWGQILDQVDAVKGLRDANLANGMAMGDADKAYDQQLGSLRNTLVQMGFNKKVVDELIGKYRAIPGKINTTATANTAPATNAIAKLIQYANSIDGRTIRIATEVSGAVNASGWAVAKRWGGVTENRRGGFYEHAAAGTLRQAQIASPVGTARYAWAEQATGGEAFIPKFGDFGRSVGILSRAADWYGMGVAPKARMVAMGGRSGAIDYQRMGASVAANLAPTLAAVASGGGDVIVQLDGVEIARATRSGDRDLNRRG